MNQIENVSKPIVVLLEEIKKYTHSLHHTVRGAGSGGESFD
jgi:hypothetical protein